MSIIDTIKAKAKADVKHIVLPEGSEERTVQAARLITDQGIAKVTLIGKSEDIKAAAARFNVNVDDIATRLPLSCIPDTARSSLKCAQRRALPLSRRRRPCSTPCFSPL